MRLTPKAAAALAAAALVLAFTVFRPPAAPGPIERDFEAYYAAGATVNAGGDPYSRAVWNVERRIPGVSAERDELLPFVGPAATLPFWSLLARLPHGTALAVWTAILVAALAGIFAAALRLARAPRDAGTYGCAAALTIASAPVVSALALGQAALVSAAGVAGALVAYRARLRAGAFGATLLAAVQPNLALALVARMRSRFDIAIAAGAAAAFALLTLTANGGAAGFLSYLHRLGAHRAAERDVAIQHTAAAVAYSFGLAPPLAAALGTAVAVAAVAALMTLIVRERLDATTASLVTCALLPLAIPFFHQPDFVLELLPVLVLALRAQGSARGLASVAAVLVLVDWFGFAQRHVAQGQIVCLGFAFIFAFAGLRRPSARGVPPEKWGLAALVGLTAIALPLGTLKPAPVWPDMLPRSFHAEPAADASAVWAAEQRAVGLTAREPAWGFLRGLPLAGCVVLSAALVAEARRRRRIPTLRGPRRWSPPLRDESAALPGAASPAAPTALKR
jgi:hypothetical protein